MHRAHLWPWDEMLYQTGGLLFEFIDLEMIEHTMNFRVLRKNDKHFFAGKELVLKRVCKERAEKCTKVHHMIESMLCDSIESR